jgi:hypothetical protein
MACNASCNTSGHRESRWRLPIRNRILLIPVSHRFFFRNENKKEIEGDQNKKLIEFPPELQMSIDVNRLNSLDGRYRLGTHIIMNEPKLVLKDAGPFSYPMN